MILIKCLVKIDQSLDKQSEKKRNKKQKTNKKTTNKQKELTTTNEKLHENCKIVELYEKKTAPLIDKTRMKKRNPIPIVHCAIFGQIHGEELSNCHTIENQIARTVAW